MSLLESQLIGPLHCTSTMVEKKRIGYFAIRILPHYYLFIMKMGNTLKENTGKVFEPIDPGLILAEDVLWAKIETGM